eukprot:gnl/TRDRNA2_/TRDRNA2_130508_c0_seq2.p1 gnl/TRDRNA2_/TRDRNA2_130508_c0~~gnl/TRDRNA2_/TRDRNA2_130508_c0_seq2.p1  ORF type:complete len:1147 (-),score=239.42 gnl/TRDRNA2_/TRDRNA2_130508_c0_seq2:48-3488(-)
MGNNATGNAMGTALGNALGGHQPFGHHVNNVFEAPIDLVQVIQACGENDVSHAFRDYDDFSLIHKCPIWLLSREKNAKHVMLQAEDPHSTGREKSVFKVPTEMLHHIPKKGDLTLENGLAYMVRFHHMGKQKTKKEPHINPVFVSPEHLAHFLNEDMAGAQVNQRVSFMIFQVHANLRYFPKNVAEDDETPRKLPDGVEGEEDPSQRPAPKHLAEVLFGTTVYGMAYRDPEEVSPEDQTSEEASMPHLRFNWRFDAEFRHEVELDGKAVCELAESIVPQVDPSHGALVAQVVVKEGGVLQEFGVHTGDVLEEGVQVHGLNCQDIKRTLENFGNEVKANKMKHPLLPGRFRFGRRVPWSNLPLFHCDWHVLNPGASRAQAKAKHEAIARELEGEAALGGRRRKFAHKTVFEAIEMLQRFLQASRHEQHTWCIRFVMQPASTLTVHDAIFMIRKYMRQGESGDVMHYLQKACTGLVRCRHRRVTVLLSDEEKLILMSSLKNQLDLLTPDKPAGCDRALAGGAETEAKEYVLQTFIKLVLDITEQIFLPPVQEQVDVYEREIHHIVKKTDGGMIELGMADRRRLGKELPELLAPWKEEQLQLLVVIADHYRYLCKHCPGPADERNAKVQAKMFYEKALEGILYPPDVSLPGMPTPPPQKAEYEAAINYVMYYVEVLRDYDNARRISADLLQHLVTVHAESATKDLVKWQHNCDKIISQHTGKGKARLPPKPVIVPDFEAVIKLRHAPSLCFNLEMPYSLPLQLERNSQLLHRHVHIMTITLREDTLKTYIDQVSRLLPILRWDVPGESADADQFAIASPKHSARGTKTSMPRVDWMQCCSIRGDKAGPEARRGSIFDSAPNAPAKGGKAAQQDAKSSADPRLEDLEVKTEAGRARMKEIASEHGVEEKVDELLRHLELHAQKSSTDRSEHAEAVHDSLFHLLTVPSRGNIVHQLGSFLANEFDIDHSHPLTARAHQVNELEAKAESERHKKAEFISRWIQNDKRFNVHNGIQVVGRASSTKKATQFQCAAVVDINEIHDPKKELTKLLRNIEGEQTFEVGDSETAPLLPACEIRAVEFVADIPYLEVAYCFHGLNDKGQLVPLAEDNFTHGVFEELNSRVHRYVKCLRGFVTAEHVPFLSARRERRVME